MIRVSGGLPRGGLGFAGVASGLASFVVSFKSDLAIALPLSIGSLIFGLWCAAGLRRDDEAGELSDRFVWRRRPNVFELITGDRTDYLLRFSTLLITLSLVSIVIEVARLLF